MDSDTLVEAHEVNRLLIELSTVRISLMDAAVTVPSSMDPTLGRLADLLENLVARLARQDAEAHPERPNAG